MAVNFSGSIKAKAIARQKEKQEKMNLFERAKKNALEDLDQSIRDAKARWKEGLAATPDNPIVHKRTKSGKELPPEKWQIKYSHWGAPNWRIATSYETKEVNGEKVPVKFKVKDPETGKLAKDADGNHIERNLPKAVELGQETVYLFLKINGKKPAWLSTGQEGSSNYKTEQEEIKEPAEQVISTLESWKEMIESAQQDNELGQAILEFAKSVDNRNSERKLKTEIRKDGKVVRTHAKDRGYVWSDEAVDFVKA